MVTGSQAYTSSIISHLPKKMNHTPVPVIIVLYILHYRSHYAHPYPTCPCPKAHHYPTCIPHAPFYLTLLSHIAYSNPTCRITCPFLSHMSDHVHIPISRNPVPIPILPVQSHAHSYPTCPITCPFLSHLSILVSTHWSI